MSPNSPVEDRKTISGSSDNAGVENIRYEIFAHEPGKVSISNRSSEKASSIVITDEGVFISNRASSGGIKISNDGVSTQGVFKSTSKGENIIKGEYSENSKSTKIFTYQETILPESVPAELASAVAGKAGVNLLAGNDFGMNGVVPIFTDLAPGPIPHFHSISMKHVHRIEPQYLYRVPPIISSLSAVKDNIIAFFK